MNAEDIWAYAVVEAEELLELKPLADACYANPYLAAKIIRTSMRQTDIILEKLKQLEARRS